MLMGRLPEAAREMTQALTLDPLSKQAISALAYISYYGGDHEGALRECRRAVALDPSYFETYGCLGLTQIALGNMEDAIDAFREADRLTGSVFPLALAFLAYVLGLAGKVPEARELLAGLYTAREQGYVPPAYLAIAEIGLGEIERAFTALDHACEAKDGTLLFLESCRSSSRSAPMPGSESPAAAGGSRIRAPRRSQPWTRTLARRARRSRDARLKPERGGNDDGDDAAHQPRRWHHVRAYWDGAHDASLDGRRHDVPGRTNGPSASPCASRTSGSLERRVSGPACACSTPAVVSAARASTSLARLPVSGSSASRCPDVRRQPPPRSSGRRASAPRSCRQRRLPRAPLRGSCIRHRFLLGIHRLCEVA